jgi:exodeoxyribonuclease V gamma subunit
MERWLSMELSRRLGVWANPDFPFPRAVIERAFRSVLGEPAADPRRFDPEVMTWALAARLQGLAGRSGFEDLDRYLAVDPTPARRVQLASRIAYVFDGYVTYRPEMIASWEAGRDAGWQAVLWRDLVAHLGGEHLASRARRFLEALQDEGASLSGFPERISLFGITTLPPLYVELLAAISRRVDVELFLLRPARQPRSEGPAASPLWASLGEVGRQFHQVLEGHTIREASCSEPSDGDGPQTLLAAVQESIGGRDVDGTAPRAERPRLDDGSIRIHACHGPMREVEVLEDQLRALFEADASLEPRDVIVMTPDVERYAPFIESVFESPRDASLQRGDPASIDYRIADRRVRATHAVVDALWKLLDVLSGRFAASAVVDLLMVDRIRDRFAISEDEVEELIDWIARAGIRWGVDAEHRREAGQPPLAQNTWREGIDRLLLALALPADGRTMFAGALPASGFDPARSDLLGRFLEFCETLFASREQLAGSHGLADWCEVLAQVMDRLTAAGPDAAPQQARVREALRALAERAGEVDFEEEVALDTVREELSRQLERGIESHRFLTGGVTFCELVPMRSIPFRVVALLGMDDDAFPRSSVPVGFDLVARSPRPGDRTARDDDRYLFLEALVSARDHLIVTHSGRSLRDGARRAPSVVVDELVDEALRLAGEADRASGRAQLVVDHPLHGFSPRYFDAGDPRLFSHSQALLSGARALVEARGRADGEGGAPWVRSPLATPMPVSSGSPPGRPGGSDEVLDVGLDELARFFEHPVRAFLQRRFGLYLRDEVEPLQDREAFALDSLDRWIHNDALLRARLDGLDPDAAAALVRAEGRLPPGAIGDVAERASRLQISRFLERVADLREGGALPALPVDLRIGRFRVRGVLGDLWRRGRVAYQLSTLPNHREASFWIRHLALNASASGDLPRESFLVGRAPASRKEETALRHLPPCDEPETLLEDLLELYVEGQRQPLPLLRGTSRRYAEECRKSGEWGPPSVGLLRDWDSSFTGAPPDREDHYLLQAFRDVDPLDPSVVIPGIGFAEAARRVWEPYLQQLEEA